MFIFFHFFGIHFAQFALLVLAEMPPLSDSERNENAALRLKNGSCEDDEPSQDTNRAAAQTLGGATSGLTQD